jgi:glycerophosphoryl diester phosphodiesterase
MHPVKPALAGLIAALWRLASGLPAQAGLARAYDREVQAEDPAAREARHRRVAERRAGTIIICHRGASAFAPENTLEAYAAAVDYGADGCEIDIRRTADGVLVLFHDDMLDRLTDGFGTVERITYYRLLSLEPRFIYGTANWETRPPTFASLLTLARQRAMLLHLDVKRPGLEADIAKVLDEADAWDHVVAVNASTAPALAKDSRLKLLSYKGPGLFEGRKDLDPEAVRAQLDRPGQMIIVDDPRVAARELKRPAYQPVLVPDNLRERWLPVPIPEGGDWYEAGDPDFGPKEPFEYWDFLTGWWRKSLPKPSGTGDVILTFSKPAERGKSTVEERREPDGDAEYQNRRTRRIVFRAWEGVKLGRNLLKTPEIVRKLEFEVRNRSLHRDWMFHGLDGAMAARALGQLGAKASVPVLVEAFRRIDPDLKKVANPEFGQHPLAWTDFRTKMYIIPALGELRCPASKKFLQEYLAMDEAKAREIAPLMYEDATRALLRQQVTLAEIEALLRSRHSGVRGTAVLECLDHPKPVRTAALKAAAPWALELPRARQRQ